MPPPPGCRAQCPWGVKAFTGYLGPDKEQWKAYDATELVGGYTGPDPHILVDQGSADSFLPAGQLLPEHLQVCAYVYVCVGGL